MSPSRENTPMGAPLIPFSVFGFQFSVKRLLIIRRLAIKFVAEETELGIRQTPSSTGGCRAATTFV
jgi:hypothetical protein